MTGENQQLDTSDRDRLERAAGILQLLARLHDREPDAALLEGLREHAVADWIGASTVSQNARRAVAGLAHALEELPDPLDQDALDDLAAEYADIYLTHSYRIAPTGSVWLTDDHLERQAPMFAVREWYEHYDNKVPDWRVRSDDHLVHELQFAAHLCELGTSTSTVDAAHFLDEHVLSWVPDFTRQMAERSKLAFFVASANLTGAFIEDLRDLLEAVTGIERPGEEDTAPKQHVELSDVDIDRPFVPGQSESW